MEQLKESLLWMNQIRFAPEGRWCIPVFLGVMPNGTGFRPSAFCRVRQLTTATNEANRSQ